MGKSAIGRLQGDAAYMNMFLTSGLAATRTYRGKTAKGLIFFFAAMVSIVLLTIIANLRSKVVAKLNAPEDGVRKLFTCGNWLVAVSPKGEVYTWDWNQLTLKPRKYSFDAEDLTVTGEGFVIFAPRPHTETLVIRDLQGKAEEKVIQLGANWRCKTLCTSLNGKFTAAGLVDEKTPGRVGLGFVDCETGNVGIVVINAGIGGELLLKNVAISEDGALLAGVGGQEGGWIAVANVKDKKVLWEKTLEGTDKLYEASFSPDGKRIYTGYGFTVYDFEVLPDKLVRKLTIDGSDRQEYITKIGVSPGVGLIAAGGIGSGVTIWNTDSSAKMITIMPAHHIFVGMVFSPDSSLLATADMRADGIIKIWRIPKPR